MWVSAFSRARRLPPIHILNFASMANPIDDLD